MKLRARVAATSLIVILLAALALRLGYAWQEVRTTPRLALEAVPFQYEPGVIAYSLATGQGFSSPLRVETGPTAWTTPIYPLIVAGLFEIFGTFTFHAFLTAVFLNILFSTLTCVPIFYAGRRIGGLTIGAGAAWLWAVFPNAIIIPYQWVWDTSLSGLLVATILWATLAVADSHRVRDWCAYGLLWGLALMTNATLLSALPLLLGWMAYRARKRGSRWLTKPALAAAIVVLCCVPWTMRNYAVLHSFVPLRSALGLQLWLGNNDQYRGAFPGQLHPIDNQAERAKFIRMGEIPYMREKRHEAIQWMLSHPRREAQLFKDRFVATWLGTPHPFRDFLRTPFLWLRWVFICNFLASPGALLGMVILFRDRACREYAFPAAVFPVVYPFAFYLTQALLRYRYPIDPIVLLLAAVAAVRLFGRAARIGARNIPAAAGARVRV